VISDTVGFIRKLPHQLVESFKSTLEEVSQADLLLHMVDCSEEDLDGTIKQTRQVLADIGADDIPYLLLYNKIDSNPEFLPPLSDNGNSFLISARDGTGMAAIQAELIARSNSPQTVSN
jgi:GTP-binding protein HflX